MNKIKRVFTGIIASAMALSLVPASAVMAEEIDEPEMELIDASEEGMEFNLTDGEDGVEVEILSGAEDTGIEPLEADDSTVTKYALTDMLGLDISGTEWEWVPVDEFVKEAPSGELSCYVQELLYSTNGELVEVINDEMSSTEIDEAGLYTEWTFEPEVISISNSGPCLCFYDTKTSGEYTATCRLYDADGTLLDEKTGTFQVIDNEDSYYLTLETDADMDDIHAGDTISLRAHITYGGPVGTGRDVTDLTDEHMAILWNNFPEGHAYHIAGRYASLEGGISGAVFSGAEFSGVYDDSYMGDFTWANSQQTDTVEVTFTEPGIYYITADSSVFHGRLTDGVLTEDYIIKDAKREGTYAEIDTIMFTVLDEREEVEEVPDEDEDTPEEVTEDINEVEETEEIEEIADEVVNEVEGDIEELEDAEEVLDEAEEAVVDDVIQLYGDEEIVEGAQTGDYNNMALYLVLSLAAMGVIAVAVRRRQTC